MFRTAYYAGEASKGTDMTLDQKIAAARECAADWRNPDRDEWESAADTAEESGDFDYLDWLLAREDAYDAYGEWAYGYEVVNNRDAPDFDFTRFADWEERSTWGMSK